MRQLKTRSSIVFVIFATICNYATETEAAEQWSYFGENGPSTWGGVCAVGQAQSPVNLENPVYEKSLTAIHFSNYDEKLIKTELSNNGHTAKLSLKSNSAVVPEISGGGLNGTYHFAQLHFHWGKTSKSGSEHWMNSEPYPLEVHLVHYNKKYVILNICINIVTYCIRNINNRGYY